MHTVSGLILGRLARGLRRDGTCLFLLCAIAFGPLQAAPQPRSDGSAKKFHNPILAGFYPDPSICRVGEDYYLVASSFSYFPGIPIFQSRDLVNWRLIGHVLDRPEQLNLDSLGVSRGIFAPGIRYHAGIFYVTCTLVDRGGNFVVTATSAAGPWSNPAWLPGINGIDPTPFFDDDGSAYVVYNSIAPDNTPLYDGHRTIRMRGFDAKTLTLTGEERILVNGGTDIAKKPVWIEAPRIFRKDGSYYLIAAEGGTGDQHSEVVFRSDRVDGPYVPYEHNPILTQRQLDPRRNAPITCTGHADFVETVNGEWWSVFLGCRPYAPFEQGLYNTGRETFLAPVRWEGGWPVINPDHDQVQYVSPAPVIPVEGTLKTISGKGSRSGEKKGGISRELRAEVKRESRSGAGPYGGNYVTRDDFGSSVLQRDWVFLRTPREKWYSLSERPGSLSIRVRPGSCSQPVNPSFLGRRQAHARGAASTSIDFSPATDREKAGLLVFQNETHFYFLCKSLRGGVPVVELHVSAMPEKTPDGMELITSRMLTAVRKETPLRLKIEARGDTYAFFYASGKEDWHLLRDGVPASFLSTKVAGGFVGCLYAMYATSLDSPSPTRAYVDWFEYTGDDEAYR